MEKASGMEKLMEKASAGVPAEELKQELTALLQDPDELLQLFRHDEREEVRRLALEQLARLSDRLSPEVKDELRRTVERDLRILYPNPPHFYGMVCPDCGAKLDKSGLNYDATFPGWENPEAEPPASFCVCPNCGRREGFDFSVPRPEWVRRCF